MNWRQKTALWIGLAAAAAVFTVPPWKNRYHFTGFHPLWHPYGFIDAPTLTLQWMLVAAAAAVAIVTNRHAAGAPPQVAAAVGRSIRRSWVLYAAAVVVPVVYVLWR